MKKFDVVIDKSFKNVEHIHPLQQWKVAELIDDFKENPNILKLIIFGSSVTEACHAGSDVDFYVELLEDKKVMRKGIFHDFLYDQWTNFTTGEKLMDEIRKKGVVVYERK